MLFFWFFIIAFVLRLLTYIFRILRCNWAYDMYLENHEKNNISRLKPILENIFTECNCKFVDISSIISDKKKMIDYFETSIGYYLVRISMNFYPNYWLKKIFKDPMDHIFNRLVKDKKIIKAIVLFFATIVCWLGGTIDFASVFSAEVLNTLEIVHRLIDLILK